MELIGDVIKTTLESFDFAYCIIVNVLTYILINIINDKRKTQLMTTWQKRLTLLLVIFSTGMLYYLTGSDCRILLNSAILAPVFWSWIFKPLCKKLKIDYKDIKLFE